ncbi:MAG: hypothetical protein EHM20_04915 [Alphaproteobacteria bacterium]|nr:MAG: hypothetical protein EHM20_04915 [Alphaproteobacteria bacterium]
MNLTIAGCFSTVTKSDVIILWKFCYYSSHITGSLATPEYQQTRQSKKLERTFQKQAAPVKQTTVSNPVSMIQRQEKPEEEKSLQGKMTEAI